LGWGEGAGDRRGRGSAREDVSEAELVASSRLVARHGRCVSDIGTPEHGLIESVPRRVALMNWELPARDCCGVGRIVARGGDAA